MSASFDPLTLLRLSLVGHQQTKTQYQHLEHMGILAMLLNILTYEMKIFFYRQKRPII